MLGVRMRLRTLLAGVALVSALAAPALARGPASVSDLARELSGAVVNIGTSRMVGGAGEPYPDFPPGSPLEELFNERNPNSGEGEQAMREARSLGSGFIVDASGLIVTNNHVIEGADEILVFTADGERFEAELVGSDDKTDLAVLKVSAGHVLPFVKFGNSDDAEVGDWVMAIGNPFGLGGSVTLGIVSARNRNINSGPYDNFIQTDAAINQGNSGGPLFDMEGNVVGINTAIISRTGGGLGIGFAVPSNLASPVIEQLTSFGETRRGWLGIGIQEVSLDIAESLGRNDTHGALIVDITQGGPSDGALREGDVILLFEGRPIVTMRDLPLFVAQTGVGRLVNLKVLRDGKEADIHVTLGRLETNAALLASAEPMVPPVVAEPPVPPGAGLADLIGFSADVLDDNLRAALELDASAKGVVISDVVAGSDGAKKGLTPGLIILEVNQRQVASLSEIEDLINGAREAGRPAVLLKVADRDGQNHFLAVKLN